MNKKLHLTKTYITQHIVAFVLVASVTSSNAQSIQRQSIGSAGTGVIADGITVTQTVGQPYSTVGYSNDEFSIHPGFQQSNQIMNVVLINSTFNLHLNVYPNPAVYSVNIVSDGVINNASLQVIDISGKLIVNEKIAEMRSYQINCETWQNGVYIITLSDEKNNKYSSKLVINK